MAISIQQAIRQATQFLQAHSDTAHLDAELLVMKAIDKTREYILAYSETYLTDSQQQILTKFVERRIKGEPIAYILGHQEFWSLDLIVNHDVLIPRPETEHLVEWTLAKFKDNENLKIADLGVGSGAIALAIAKERPDWQINATEFSDNALNIAKKNANIHHLKNINFYQGSWFETLPDNDYDVILSNPPYIDEQDPHLIQLKYEPRSALNGGKDGMEALTKIIQQAPSYLKKGGYLILEHGFDQEDKVVKLLQQAGFDDIEDHNDLAGVPRFSTAKKP